MADVFVSYKKEDRALAEAVVAAVEAAGYGAWWDNDLTPRTTWDAEIEREIEAARAVLVLWTPRSVSEKSFVRNEADYAMQNGKLVPAWLERCNLPLAFRRVQTADLTRWDRRDQSHLEWRKVLGWIGTLVGRGAAASPAPAPMAAPRGALGASRRGLIIGGGVAAIGVGGVALALSPLGQEALTGVSVTSAGRRVIWRIAAQFDLPENVRRVQFTARGNILAEEAGSQYSFWSEGVRRLVGARGIPFYSDGAVGAHGVLLADVGFGGARGRRVRIVDELTGETRQTLEGHTSEIHDAAFSPDGRFVAASASDGMLRIWNAESGAEIAADRFYAAPEPTYYGESAPARPEPQRIVVDFAWSPDGSVIYVAAGGKIFKKPSSAESTATTGLLLDLPLLSNMRLSPDGATLAARFQDEGGWRTGLWGVSGGPLIRSLTGYSEAIFLQEGAQLLLRRQGNVVVLDTRSGETLRTFELGDVRSLIGVSAKGDLLALFESRDIWLCDPQSGTTLARIITRSQPLLRSDYAAWPHQAQSNLFAATDINGGGRVWRVERA